MKTFIHVLAFAVLSAAMFGCEMNLEGEEGEVQFTDLTETPLDIFNERADGPVATNSTFRIKISEPGLTLASLSSSDDEILSLVEVRPIYGTEEQSETQVATELVTKTGSAGTARLSVALGEGRSDYIDIDVVAPTSNSITLFPYFGIFTLNLDMWSEGFALVQDGEFQLFGNALDDKGDRLMGAGAVDWFVEGENLSVVDLNEENDFIKVKSNGELGKVLRVDGQEK